MLNQQIQNYKIISPLGEGGMANVYLAQHQSLGNNVALKLLKEEYVQHPNIRKRFLAEARNLAQMSHPNIIKVTDLIDAGDIVAFVMEYIEGDTLEHYIEHNGKLPNEEIESFIKQMIEAVEYVHSQGLIHRDIKPSNFMLTKGGAIKLLDFGIAKNTNDDAADYTKTGLMQQMGTPMYMSPEQVKNTSEVTKETDIYSLGVVLWQMVTGKKPYNSDTLSLPEIQVAILKEPLSLTDTVWDEKIQSLTEKTVENRTVNLFFIWSNKRKVRQSEIKNEMGRNNSQSDNSKIDNASSYRNVNSSTNSQKAKYAANSKQDKEERKSYFNLKTVSIGIGILLFIGILIIFNLSKDGFSVPIKTSDASKLEIGQKYQGGIIFYLDNSGKHGRVFTERDLGKFDWYAAMEVCKNLRLNGFSDWYLPSITELREIYDHQSVFGFFESNYYWSSTEYVEYDVNRAWGLDFLNGLQSYSGKDLNIKKYPIYVRAVRAF